MHNMKQILAVGASAAALGWALAAHAAPSPQSVNVTVTATVNGSCNLTKNSDLAFGGVDPLGAAPGVAAVAGLTLQCNRGAAPILDIGVSANAASCSGSSRCMVQSGSYLNYNIYLPSASGTDWTTCPATGTGTVWEGASTLNATSSFAASGGNRSISLCGQLPLPQASVPANASAYTDTVTVTATF